MWSVGLGTLWTGNGGDSASPLVLSPKEGRPMLGAGEGPNDERTVAKEETRGVQERDWKN